MKLCLTEYQLLITHLGEALVLLSQPRTLLMPKDNPVHRIFGGVAVTVQVGLCDRRVFNGLLQREIEGLRDVGAEKGLDVVDTGEVVYGPDLKIQRMSIPAS